MRLAGQSQLGFYPLDNDIARMIASKLHVEYPKHTTILDPCCGKGLAVEQLAAFHAVPEENLFLVELDQGRATEAQGFMPRANFITTDGHTAETCAFSGLVCTYNTFSLVYINPPFDNELGGGGREEFGFLRSATNLIDRTIGGILVMVSPITTFTSSGNTLEYLDSFYEDSRLYTLPPKHRKYKEAVFIGRRRREPVPAKDVRQMQTLLFKDWFTASIADPSYHHVWQVPPANRPKRWFKGEFTHQELLEKLNASPLRALYEPPAEVEVVRPGMKLGTGHQGILVASGYMNGVIQKEGEPPFVVRGTVGKESYLKEFTPPDSEGKGSKSHMSEDINLSVRYVDGTGEIYTLTSGSKGKEKEVMPV